MAVTVSLAGVSKHFQQRPQPLPVLQQIDLQIRAGEFVAILGPSGCGKSTLLRLLAGLDHPSDGEVRLGGQVVTEADPRSAVVFQEPRLFPWKSVAANIAVGTRRLDKKPSPDELLQLVGLTGFGPSYPYQLSGGMAQRAALARALIGQPGVLLLDEPFASLDALTRMHMQDLLTDVHARLQPTVVMVTHDVDEAIYLADRVVIMSHRPATVTAIRQLRQPRPRQRGDAAFALLRAEILTFFGFCTHPATPDAGGEAGAVA